MRVQSAPPLHHVPVFDTWRPVRTSKPARRPVVARSAPGTRLAPRNLALLLQQARVGSHMSQSDLAKRANEPLSTIRAIERGDIPFPQTRLLTRLSTILGVDLRAER